MDKGLIEKHFRVILEEGLGLDMKDPNLLDTPRRVAKMYTTELFRGLNPENEPNITVFPNEDGYNQIVLSDNIRFTSTCSHHFLGFGGRAYLAYIPNKKYIGLSKLSRIVEWFAFRPQLQERLTKQVLDYLVEKLEPKGAIVVIRASHSCMNCRGVEQDSKAGMMTSAIQGVFEEAEVRSEVMSLIQMGFEK